MYYSVDNIQKFEWQKWFAVLLASPNYGPPEHGKYDYAWNMAHFIWVCLIENKTTISFEGFVIDMFLNRIIYELQRNPRTSFWRGVIVDAGILNTDIPKRQKIIVLWFDTLPKLLMQSARDRQMLFDNFLTDVQEVLNEGENTIRLHS